VPPPHQAALAKLVVKRFLLLAALLDRAVALPALPSSAPLLFRADSKLKASSQVWPWPCPCLRLVGLAWVHGQLD